MSSFLTHHGDVVALVCAAAAIAYGFITARQLLALSPGNERMRSISLAVQQGASAYLNRQYTTIAAVGVIVFIVLIPLQNIRVAIGFLVGAVGRSVADTSAVVTVLTGTTLGALAIAVLVLDESEKTFANIYSTAVSIPLSLTARVPFRSSAASHVPSENCALRWLARLRREASCSR